MYVCVFSSVSDDELHRKAQQQKIWWISCQAQCFIQLFPQFWNKFRILEMLAVSTVIKQVYVVYLSGRLLWRDAARADLQLGLDDEVDVWTKGLWIRAADW